MRTFWTEEEIRIVRKAIKKRVVFVEALVSVTGKGYEVVDRKVRKEAAKMGLSPVIFGKRRRQSEGRRRTIRDLVEAGLKPDEIGKALGVSKRDVYYHAEKLGLRWQKENGRGERIIFLKEEMNESFADIRRRFSISRQRAQQLYRQAKEERVK